MPISLTLKTPSEIPLEVDSVRLDVVREQSADEISRTLIQRGNRQIELGEFFSVIGNAGDDNTLVWRGDLKKVKLIAARLNGGRVIVEGDAGMHLGAEMTAGEVEVRGNAGDWLGAEMHGGLIRVRGKAGNLVGAVYRGGRRGMTGGEIVVDGDAGDEIGRAMRRGLIAIGGNAGDFLGASMIAGTIIVCGDVGLRHGAGMKRGTIALYGSNPVEMLPTFREVGECDLTFLRLYARRLRSLEFAGSDSIRTSQVRRFCGDMLELGKGEILTRAG